MKWVSLILLLILVVVVFVLAGLLDRSDDGTQSGGTNPVQAPQPVDVVAAPVLKSLSAYSAITERALFTRERAVKKAPRRKARKQPRQAPRLMLQALGIAVGEEGFIAIVKNRRTGQIDRLRLHQEIEGWELVSISTEGFSFQKSGKKLFVVFRKSGGGE